MADNSVNITMNFVANTAVFSNINQRLDVVSSHVNNVSNQFAQVSNRVNNVTNNVNHLGDRMGRLRSASSGIGGILSKIGAIGMGAAGVITTISAITGKMKEFAEANRAQQEAEAKLAQVMRNTMGASAAEVQSIKDLAAAQQQLGVIGDEVQLAGAQELGTYLEKADSLKRLMPVMNDMLAQQYGLNASQEQATQIASMMGKVMEGQVGALSRYGYKFDEAQEKILKYGTEEQKAATLAEVIEQSVGGMNEALAATPEGQLKQASNRLGDLKEQVGAIGVQAASAFMPLASPLLGLAERVMAKIATALQPATAFVQQLMGRVAAFIPLVEQALQPLSRIFATLMDNTGVVMGYAERYGTVIREHVLPAVQKVAGVVSRILSRIIDFFANSKIIRDFFATVWGLMGWLWDAIGWIFEQVEAFFDNIVMPLLRGIEKVYRWVAGEEEDKKEKSGKNSSALPQPAQAGIAPVPQFANGASGGLGMQADGKTAKAAEATVTGGTRNTQITINLGKMVENIVFNGSFQDSAASLQQQVEEALLRTLYAAQSAAV